MTQSNDTLNDLDLFARVVDGKVAESRSLGYAHWPEHVAERLPVPS